MEITRFVVLMLFSTRGFLAVQMDEVPHPLDNRKIKVNGTREPIEFKTNQWFGATVKAHKEKVVACAPLYHWRTLKDSPEKDPVGTCYVAIQNFSAYAEYSPCRNSYSVAAGEFTGDSEQDIAIGAPFAGEDRRGKVLIYNGYSNGLNPNPSQVLSGAWASQSVPSGFGFTLRGDSDVDKNDYPAIKALRVLSCDYKMENETRMVVCDLGNPMVAGANFSTGIRFSVQHFENSDFSINFELQIKRVSHPPTIILPLHNWEPKDEPTKEEEVGPLVEHIYEVS
ncbi:hypothetical protein DV515_00001484, partial [Chloebia gouldiae]